MVDVRKFKEEEEEGYTVNIIGRNAQVTEAMKNHLWDKLDKIERFHNHIMHVTVILDIQRLEHTVTIMLKIDHLEVKVAASSTDMYASIDEAIRRLQSKLRRWKSRIQEHHRRHKDIAAIEMDVAVMESRKHDETEEYNQEIEATIRQNADAALFPPKVIGKETISLRKLTTDEAVMKYELSGDPFLIYRDEADLKIKVIYHRPDGNYGVVQTTE